MPQIDIVFLPSSLKPHHLRNRAVAVFDVLRATTTIATAMAHGAQEIHIFGALDAARRAASAFPDAKLLCGERNCLAPEGFDLGNSPGDFTAERVRGKIIFMCTTNGTRALVAAQGASKCFAAALVNRSATAKALAKLGMDVTLLCSGTDGQIADEDLIGAGSVLDALGWDGDSAETRQALGLFHNSRASLPQALMRTLGGQNVIRAGLDADIGFASQLDAFDVVVEVSGDPPVARPMILS